MLYVPYKLHLYNEQYAGSKFSVNQDKYVNMYRWSFIYDFINM